ncbi:hypothetical protein [Scopulibacillus cellulosilyticus]|uniref:Uncharacterized protein n=1 Tax=Scopulibacillus cellulosilyticus TaxID=2665665 RepID=A0ABW2PYW3_9BACL
MTKWFSVMEIEKVTGIPNALVRGYIRNHGRHLILKKKHKDFLIASDSVNVVESIYLLYTNGMNTEQVEKCLEEIIVPKTAAVTDENGNTLQDLNEAVIEQVYEQNLLNQRQKQAVDEKLKKRDEKLTTVLRRKKHIEEKPGFFKRLFNKS